MFLNKKHYFKTEYTKTKLSLNEKPASLQTIQFIN